MEKEIKDLLKNEIKSVNQSRLKVIIGSILLSANILLLFLGLLDITTLVFTLVLIFSLWSIIVDYRVNKAGLALMRYIVDDEYRKAFNKENNLTKST